MAFVVTQSATYRPPALYGSYCHHPRSPSSVAHRWPLLRGDLDSERTRVLRKNKCLFTSICMCLHVVTELHSVGITNKTVWCAEEYRQVLVEGRPGGGSGGSGPSTDGTFMWCLYWPRVRYDPPRRGPRRQRRRAAALNVNSFMGLSTHHYT